MTTRATTSDRTEAADKSLALLEHINLLIGPINANLGHAFSFSQQIEGAGKRKLNKRQLAKTSEDDSETNSDSFEHPEFINLDLANEEALFKNAEDFWHIVGWAFNCSVKHKTRWDRWRLWLNYHLNVIENDWKLRMDRPEQPHRAVEGQSSDTPLEGSIIMRYLQPLGAGASRTARRRAMRSILARASFKDLTEFPEVFRNELKERKKEPTAEESRQRQRVNIDEGDFGDYFDEDNDEAESSTATDGISIPNGKRRAVRRGPKGDSHPGNEEILTENNLVPSGTSLIDWGGATALELRQRLLVILTQASLQLPEQFVNLAELLDIYTEFMRPLPVSVFAELMSPSSMVFKKVSYSTEVYISLVQMLLHALVGSAKAPKVQLLKLPTQHDIQRAYLSCASSSSAPADNAKISLLLEGLLRVLMQQSQGIQAGLGFKADLEWGIEVRRAKASNMFSTAKTTRVRDEDAEAHQWLASSEARLALMAEILEEASPTGT